MAVPMAALGHELPRHLAERAAVMPPKAAAPHATRAAEAGQQETHAPQQMAFASGDRIGAGEQ
jgi:hypothetical protein